MDEESGTQRPSAGHELADPMVTGTEDALLRGQLSLPATAQGRVLHMLSQNNAFLPFLWDTFCTQWEDLGIPASRAGKSRITCVWGLISCDNLAGPYHPVIWPNIMLDVSVEIFFR